MPVDHAQLRSELTTNVTGIAGLTTAYTAGQDQVCANLLNAVNPSITVRRGDVSSVEIWSAIDVADMTALPASPSATQLSQERRALAWLSGVAAVPSVRLLNADGTDSPVIDNFQLSFSPGSATLTRLAALASRPGSRAEQLFNGGTRLTAEDIRLARLA